MKECKIWNNCNYYVPKQLFVENDVKVFYAESAKTLRSIKWGDRGTHDIGSSLLIDLLLNTLSGLGWVAFKRCDLNFIFVRKLFSVISSLEDAIYSIK